MAIKMAIQKTIKIHTIGDQDSWCLGCDNKGETYCGNTADEHFDEDWDCLNCTASWDVHPGMMTCRHCQP